MLRLLSPGSRLPQILSRPRRNRAVFGLSAGVCLTLYTIFANAEQAPPQNPAEAQPATGNPQVAAANPRKSAIRNPQSAIANDVRIETFAPDHGYIVGVENVVLLCVVRNLGSAPLPENQLRLRCYPISGLDYTNGNLLPVLPALAPGQAVTYRWRFAPSDARNALIAGVVLERTDKETRRKGEEETQPTTGQPPAGNAPPPLPPSSQPLPLSPQLAFAVVPRLPRALALGEVPALKDPLAHAGEQNGSSLLLNSRVVVRVQIGDRRETTLILGAKEGTVWRTVATTVSPLRVCAAEDGQLPWWQSFRCQQVRAREDKNSATLTLTGTIGNACRAEITLEARPDTCVIMGKARLTALRSLRLSGMQLPALLTASDDKTLPAPRADGAPFLLPDPPALLPDDARLAAAHSGATTFGVTWPADPPFPAWKWNRLPLADGLNTSILGAQATSDTRGDTLSAGSSLEVAFRWFAFAPSDTLRDAQRFQMP